MMRGIDRQVDTACQDDQMRAHRQGGNHRWLRGDVAYVDRLEETRPRNADGDDACDENQQRSDTQQAQT